jgi:hypothetical protein
MKKASEYRQHAEECRAIARSMIDDGQREQLLNMAETWEQLAAERDQDKPPRPPRLIFDPDDSKGG